MITIKKLKKLVVGDELAQRIILAREKEFNKTRFFIGIIIFVIYVDFITLLDWFLCDGKGNGAAFLYFIGLCLGIFVALLIDRYDFYSNDQQDYINSVLKERYSEVIYPAIVMESGDTYIKTDKEIIKLVNYFKINKTDGYIRCKVYWQFDFLYSRLDTKYEGLESTNEKNN